MATNWTKKFNKVVAQINTARGFILTPSEWLEGVENEEICSRCGTDEDVEQCMECDRYYCIECDPNEMATYGEGHSCSTLCEPCSRV